MKKRIKSTDFFNEWGVLDKLWARLAFVGTLMVLTATIGMNVIGFLVLLLFYSSYEARKTNKTPSKFIKEYLISSLFVIVMYKVFTIAGAKGLFYIFCIYVLLVLYILYHKRELYINGIRSIETKVWGKPLEKKYWKKNEFKNTKLKLVWRKK